MKTTEQSRIANLGNYAHPPKKQTQSNAGKLIGPKGNMGKQSKSK